jgi:F0F1-type ATP synthase membrane subunit c/vacuolar-type H+-ATPase subunit K
VAAAAEVVYGERSPNQWWTVLTVWARPGLVAAMLIIAAVAFGAGIWVGQSAGAASAATALDPLRTDSEQLAVPALLAARQAPDVDVVMAAALGQ